MITRKDINKVLVSLGAPAGNLGFEYIITAILIKQEEAINSVMKLEKSVADVHKASATGVERAIRHQFETIEKKKSGPYVEIFGDTDHIKVKDGLCALYNYLDD